MSDVSVKRNYKHLGDWSNVFSDTLNDMFLGKHESTKWSCGNRYTQE